MYRTGTRYTTITHKQPSNMKRESLSSLIADTAIQHYKDVLPKKGKPIPGKEWTVYAAIVATSTSAHGQDLENDDNDSGKDGGDNGKGSIERAWVVSCATGSKCTAVNSAVSSNFSKVEIPPCAAASNAEEDHNDQNKKSGQVCSECCCQEQTKGLILHDSHAEIMARRGLIRVLWKEIKHHLMELNDALNSSNSQKNEAGIPINKYGNATRYNESDKLMLLKRIVTVSAKGEPDRISFHLKEGIQLHLYISDNPCGDSSIYELSPKYSLSERKGTNGNVCDDKDAHENGNLNFTGAKIIMPTILASAPPCTTATRISNVETDNFTPCGDSNTSMSNKENNSGSIICIARERRQILSALRLKSGRSNIPQHLRSSSHSCSDKICKWIVLGLQGSGMLSSLLSAPIFLSSVIVSRDERTATDAKDHDLQSGSGTNSQHDALERALTTRATQAMQVVDKYCPELYDKLTTYMTIPNISICSQVFSEGKAAAEKDMHDMGTRTNSSNTKKRKLEDTNPHVDGHQTALKTKKTISPSGMSINWQMQLLRNKSNIINGERDKNVELEQIVGAKGIKQGKKSRRIEEIMSCASRLSRHKLFLSSLECITLLISVGMTPVTSTWAEFLKEQEHGIQRNINGNTISYQYIKQRLAHEDTKKLKKVLFKEIESPLVGWLRTLDENDFKCHTRVDKRK
jgi:hypothetical protein